MTTNSDFSLAPLPTSTPHTTEYPCQSGSQYQRNNFVPRTFSRVPSGVERGQSLLHVLRKHWGFQQFRPPQDAVFAPTGLGKSLCFQVPAVALEYGITVVVSPLKALMKEQVEGLRQRGINVASLNENTTPEEHIYIKRELKLAHPRLRLLYVTPESLFKKEYEACFRVAYQQKQIARVVVDEAHVLHEWGNGFRPRYKDVGNFVRLFPGIPKTALTASATADVRAEIIELLDMKRTSGTGLAQFVLPFNRKNLFYDIHYLGGSSHANIQAETTSAIIQFVHKFRPEAQEVHRKNGIDAPCISGLVYCRTTNSCDVVAERLNDSGISAVPFYARMSEAKKSRVLADWKNGQVECVVATIAFGMGIDHPHVRYVVHFDMPKSFEGFYQETGRAGRDGHRSRCLLIYSREDVARATSQAMSGGTERAKQQMANSLKALQQFAESTDTCRHVGICRFFGEDIDASDPGTVKSYCDLMCDVCTNRAGVYLAAQNLSDDFPTLSPIQPVEPLRHSSPTTTEQGRSNCTFAALHDETQTGPHWLDVVSPAVGSGPGGMVDAHGAGNQEDEFAALFDHPDSNPDDGAGRRENQTPLFDLPSSLPESVPPDAPLVVDLTISSSPPEVVTAKGSVKMETPSWSAVSSGRRTIPPPGTAPRRPASSILQALDINENRLPRPRAEPARRLQTIDEIADQGIAGATVVGEPRSPGHGKRKERERERVFKDVESVSGIDGPYSFYNSAAPQKRGRVDRLQFKTPGPALSVAVPQSSPLARMTTGSRQLLHGTPAPAASPAPGPVTDRKSGLARLLAAVTSTFEKGELAEEIFVAWKRREKGEQRTRLLKKAARELEARIALDTRHSGTYAHVITEMAESMKLARNERGVRLITSGQLRKLNDKRAVNFRTVEEVFRSVERK